MVAQLTTSSRDLLEGQGQAALLLDLCNDDSSGSRSGSRSRRNRCGLCYFWRQDRLVVCDDSGGDGGSVGGGGVFGDHSDLSSLLHDMGLDICHFTLDFCVRYCCCR